MACDKDKNKMALSRGSVINLLMILLYEVRICTCVQWDRIRCSTDTMEGVPEGRVPDIGRFPWLGVVQHSFYVARKTRFAITGGILIHPGYVIASAEDMAKILPGTVMNNTKFIMWKNATVKYAIDVRSYILHPEYVEKKTYATLALVELVPDGETGAGGSSDPILPIALPTRGAVVLEQLYSVRITDVNVDLDKEVTKMAAIEDDDCSSFYRDAKLDFKKMRPTHFLCAASARRARPCVWDAGAALLATQTYGYWTLLGFSVRGPGCGAPTRYLNIHSYLPWIDQVISEVADMDDQHEDLTAVVFRRVSPIKLQFYKAYGSAQESLGQCSDRGVKGNILYKDYSKLDTNMNHVQGFFFVTVSQIADFKCCEVALDAKVATNTAVWVEHNCFRDLSGDIPAIDYRRIECFKYYKSTAFIEFRFIFSHSTTLAMTMWGTVETVSAVPNPFTAKTITDAWWPTEGKIRWKYWVPTYMWWYWL